ncbi:MAG: carbon-nitrogen hydrolase [Gammaproteobacteria bacterium]|nr:MAG: carbon-nitrogen hydrolase [Gammaproteobacteria bacterium]
MKVGLVQQACGGQRTCNLKNAIAGAHQAAAQGARLVLLQELHCEKYFCQTQDPQHFDLAEPIPGPTTDMLASLAKELSVVVVGSVFEYRAPGVYHNTAVVLDNDGRLAGCYRKMHIPDDPGYHEKYYFTPGDQGFAPIETAVAKLGVLVCWDQWYPEAARLMALRGAELLLYPSAIGWDPRDDQAEKRRQRDSWITIQRAHAIANGLPVMVCNRTGFEPDPAGKSPGIQFWGSSFIAGPQGEILAQADTDSPQTLVSELSPDRIERVRRTWPFLRDRRIDAYQDLARRYGN